MDMFEKATKVVKNVSGNVMSSAKTVGTSIYSSTKEQSELASLNIQKSVIEKKLTESYAEIGKRYVVYIDKCDGDVAFDVNDLLDAMQPDLEKLADIKTQIAEKELQIKQANEERAQKKAQDEYEAEKRKLDKALDMEIITDEEYAEKLQFAKRKLDNYEILRKIQLQLEMGIISKNEYNEKINNILK